MGDIACGTREGADFGVKRRSVMVEHKSKILKIDGRGEVGEQLLPGIPNEITLDFVVAKLPWTACHKLLSVSHGWRRAVRSREVYDARVCTGSTETLVVMIHDHVKDAGTLGLYSSRDGSCSHLPSIPGFKHGLPCECECSFLDGKLYVLGGLKDSSSSLMSRSIETSAKAFVLDLATGKRQWKQVASMAESRVEFGCGVINGKIYVFGGFSYATYRDNGNCGSEVYDPVSDTWSPIEPLESPGSNQRVFTVGEECFVHGIHEFAFESGPLPNYKGFDPLEVYNPLKNQWRSMGHIMQFMDILFMVGGRLHKWVGRFEGHGTDVFDICANSWKPSQSSSFSVFGSSDSFCVSVLDAVVVDDELLCVAHCANNDDHQQIPKTYLMRSQGLGCQNKDITWQKTQCSVSFNNRNGVHHLCPIQL